MAVVTAPSPASTVPFAELFNTAPSSLSTGDARLANMFNLEFNPARSPFGGVVDGLQGQMTNAARSGRITMPVPELPPSTALPPTTDADFARLTGAPLRAGPQIVPEGENVFEHLLARPPVSAGAVSAMETTATEFSLGGAARFVVGRALGVAGFLLDPMTNDQTKYAAVIENNSLMRDRMPGVQDLRNNPAYHALALSSPENAKLMVDLARAHDAYYDHPDGLTQSQTSALTINYGRAIEALPNDLRNSIRNVYFNAHPPVFHDTPPAQKPDPALQPLTAATIPAATVALAVPPPAPLPHVAAPDAMAPVAPPATTSAQPAPPAIAPVKPEPASPPPQATVAPVAPPPPPLASVTPDSVVVTAPPSPTPTPAAPPAPPLSVVAPVVTAPSAPPPAATVAPADIVPPAPPPLGSASAPPAAPPPPPTGSASAPVPLAPPAAPQPPIVPQPHLAPVLPPTAGPTHRVPPHHVPTAASPSAHRQSLRHANAASSADNSADILNGDVLYHLNQREGRAPTADAPKTHERLLATRTNPDMPSGSTGPGSGNGNWGKNADAAIRRTVAPGTPS